MRKSVIVLISTIIFSVANHYAYTQTNNVITGNIKNSQTKENLASVSVTIKGGTAGTYTDEKGNFRLVTTQKPPFTIVISLIGYTSQEINVDNVNQPLSVELELGFALGQEIVVGGTKTPQRILESPVTIQRISSATIRQSPATSYYDIVGNLTGIDVTTSSLTFKSPTTRGFNSSGNARFNQLVDGIDNQAPGLNFSVGNIVGVSELDVDNMELLSGASSALYGSGGMNGTLLITSKNPFKYQGVSAQIKEGIMNIGNNARSASPYTDISVRWAQKISDRFAFKIGVQYITARDWLASDSTNYAVSANYQGVIPGNRQTDPSYNGVNVYGDERGIDISPFLLGVTGGDSTLIGPFLSQPVTRTGYKESEVVPSTTTNLKLTGGLFYRITPNIEASLIGYWGTGNSVYTGTDRYALKDLKIGQYKAEVKAKNWFLRIYTTQENSGQAYNATVTTQLFNEAWKPSYNPLDPANSWYPQFAGALVQAAQSVYQDAFAAATSAGQSPDQANVTAQAAIAANTEALLNGARGYADQGRPIPGSSQFNTIFDTVRNKPIPFGGLFLDRSDLWNYEGQLNLTDILKIGKEDNRFEVLAGANFKQYLLRSKGTLFQDNGGTITINETGAYLQLGQKFGDVLKLTASGRFDKNEYFKGKFTPRVTAVITVADDQNIRLSYQNAYRFPTTQNQWIDLYVGDNTRLLGGLPQVREKYNFDTNPVYTQESFADFAATGDPSKLVVQQFGEFKPETANSYEAGYKGLFANKFLIDVYGYFGKYKDFLTRINVFQDGSTNHDFSIINIYSVAVNSPTEVNTSGWGASFQYQIRNNFFANANVFGDYISNVPVGFKAYFNTPKIRFNLGFGNSGLGKAQRLGFNILYRWQDNYYNESDFRQGNVPAFGVLDAQVSYKLPKQKILFKLGGTNITNHYYITAFGNPSIGGLYYVSVAYNVF